MIHVTRFYIYDCYEFIFTIDMGEHFGAREAKCFRIYPTLIRRQVYYLYQRWNYNSNPFQSSTCLQM